MVEHEHLISQHGEPIEIVGTFVMGNGRDRGLQAGDVRFEGNRHLVAKAPLHPGADRSQEPRGRCRQAETDGRQAHEAGLVLEHALPEEHEPERDQRVGQRRKLRQHERGDHQPWFVLIPEPAQPPHRRQRGRQGFDLRFHGGGPALR
jgi:hypothetical protein